MCARWMSWCASTSSQSKNRLYGRIALSAPFFFTSRMQSTLVFRKLLFPCLWTNIVVFFKHNVCPSLFTTVMLSEAQRSRNISRCEAGDLYKGDSSTGSAWHGGSEGIPHFTPRNHCVILRGPNTARNDELIYNCHVERSAAESKHPPVIPHITAMQFYGDPESSPHKFALFIIASKKSLLDFFGTRNGDSDGRLSVTGDGVLNNWKSARAKCGASPCEKIAFIYWLRFL